MSFDYRTYRLKEHFDKFNQQYWNGDLPSGPLWWVKDAKYMVSSDTLAQFDNDEPHSRCWRIMILIPSAGSEDYVNGLLLHEMIHLQFKDDPTEQADDPDFHGEKFRAKATELEQMTGYRNIRDKGVVAGPIRAFFNEL